MVDKEMETNLVRQARRGDVHSFSLLYEMIYRDLYRTALYTLGNPEDAENVVSDTVLDAYSGISRLRSDDAFRGWIFRILSNKCNKVLREYVKKREAEVASPVEEMAETLEAGGSMESEVQNRSLVEKAFSVLEDEEKRIVTLTVYGDYDSGEISKMLGINRNTVRSKYSRALAKMRAELGVEQSIS